ncbi:glycosyltransferase family 4 protein [Pedobacter sp. AW31-3R]|uniref:glycosyltransferase family 4 protein n=1 Tax=Pedobacter sp. AW31-3R TaxID=3445781 RepID=UPI003FA17A82
MTKVLRIAIIADPELPVPPLLYGGIERMIGMLIKGYHRQGHAVSLFAHEDSVTEAKLYAYKGKTSRRKTDFLRNAWLINKSIIFGNYDIVHSFGRLAYLLPQLPLRQPKLMSYQRSPTLAQIRKAVKLARAHTLSFTGCSNYITRQIQPFAPAYTIYNGFPLETYTCSHTLEPDAPLVFLGRIERIKGTHTAIRVAIESRRKLIIAGNVPEGCAGYFDTEIAPFLNEQIRYAGAVDDAAKNELLGKAAALLMPIEWDEPFGIVMAEALACGTPVVGFSRGAVPEVVKHGLNGFLCTSVYDMVEAVKRISQIDREWVRRDAEERFSSAVIVKAYLDLYAALIKNSIK